MNKYQIEYREKLKDPRWQKKRLEVFQRDDFTCQKCGDKTRVLNVHHRHYKPQADPWEYFDFELVTLCEDCHKYETEFFQQALTELICAAKFCLFSDDAYYLALNMEKFLPIIKKREK